MSECSLPNIAIKYIENSSLLRLADFSSPLTRGVYVLNLLSELECSIRWCLKTMLRSMWIVGSLWSVYMVRMISDYKSWYCLLHNVYCQTRSSSAPMAASFFLLPITLLYFTTPTSSLTFNISDFSQSTSAFRYDRGSNYINNASILNSNLVLTTMSLSQTGRATYIPTLQLYDAVSNSLSDFTTNFSFTIDSKKQEPYADGFAFFIATVDFPMPDTQEGSGLGLVSGLYKFDTTLSLKFVAVEFDIFSNAGLFKRFEFESDHVGIDVGSVESVAGMKWKSGVLDGRMCEARVQYKAVSKELSVVFTGFESNETVLERLNYTIDLRKVLPENVCMGFAAATGVISGSHIVHSWSFDSKLVYLNDTNTEQERRSSPSNSRTGLVVGVVVSVAVVMMVGLFACAVLWRRKRRGGKGSGQPAMDNEFQSSAGPKQYPYKELARATNKFNEKNKLGAGGFGGVYKGVINEKVVAIKRVSKGSSQGLKEYASEVTIISRLRHRNLVQLLGWCHERDELLLVYEFMPNGSLDIHLFKSEVPLSWEMRFKIAQGLASALLYLHEGCDQYIVHRDIKASNIMLDSSFNAKLGDFGLAKLVDHQKNSETTGLAGTQGYIDPEGVMTGKTTKQSDVYSFGVVALELACGRKPINLQAPENEASLVDWVYDLNQDGKLLEAADPKLGNEFAERELQCLLIVGLWCTQPTRVSRPSIRQASLVLNFEAPLPALLNRMPKPLFYFNREVSGKTSEESCPQSSLGITSYSV